MIVEGFLEFLVIKVIKLVIYYGIKEIFKKLIDLNNDNNLY